MHVLFVDFHLGPVLNCVVEKVVSGGQTGVDRAALDVAIRLQIDHGGWCPQGRRSESGPIPGKYSLIETPERDYSIRTEKNVLDSDGTLILCQGPLSGGTRLTWKLAKKHGQPVLKVDLDNCEPRLVIPSFQDWLVAQRIRVLNVAGPRESTRPGIGKKVCDFLELALKE